MGTLARVIGVGVVIAAVGCGPGDEGASDAAGTGQADANTGGTADAPVAPPDAPPIVDYDATPLTIDSGVTGDADFPVDAGMFADAGQLAVCNPVAQIGCQANEKCSQLVSSDNPFLADTTCVPDGTVPIGGACIQGPPGPDTGYDDCQAGGYCSGGMCLEICSQAPDSCGAGESCVPYSNLFNDLDGIGLCNPECDVLAQDCTQDPNDPFGTGCYISLASGNSTCAPALPETVNGMPGVQGEDCMFLNTCAVGYGCTLVNDPLDPTGNTCAKFCDPTNMGGPICDDTGLADTCVIINGDFYGDASNVPTSIGFCVDCVVWADVPGCM